MTLRGVSKEDRYALLLDTARCKGNWEEVPAIVKKLEHHGSQRRCLIQTALVEHQIHQLLRHGPSLPADQLRSLLVRLKATVKSEKSQDDDLLQAKVCMAWIHWCLGETGLVLSLLSEDLVRLYVSAKGAGNDGLGWNKVCAVKGTFLIAKSQEVVGDVSEAIETYASAFPLVSDAIRFAEEVELRRWMENILESYCLLASNVALSAEEPPTLTRAIQGFRLWAKFEEAQMSSTFVTAAAVPAPSSERRQMWKAYYTILAKVLQRQLPYPLEPTLVEFIKADDAYIEYEERPKTGDILTQQMTEFKHVQSTYERILLQQILFPRAHEYNEEVEKWAGLVMENWRSLSCSSWYKMSVGADGKPSAGRDTVDILYRAAARSFHSTSILRHLFTVHTSLAEFALAFNALDTYLDLVTKEKARLKVSGTTGPGLDPDAVIVRTASEGVIILCQYGGRKGSVRAEEITKLVEVWLKNLVSATENPPTSTSNGHPPKYVAGLSQTTNETLALAYRAMGISRACWAKYTTKAPSRADIRGAAMSYCRKSLASELGDDGNLESLYTLGKLLAESQELDAAIDVVRRALDSCTHGPLSNALGPFGAQGGLASTRRRSDITNRRVAQTLPLWHLLVLLLSAKEDYDLGLTMCESVLEHFSGSARLDPQLPRGFAVGQANGSAHGPFPQVAAEPVRHVSLGHFEAQDLECLLQIKMTQLALLEVTEGADAAINSSSELLALYHQLFGDPSDLQSGPRSMPGFQLQAPKSSAGTIKSLRTSLLRKQKSTRRLLRRSRQGGSSAEMSPSLSAADAPGEIPQVFQPPMIQVTEESKVQGEQRANEHRREHSSHSKMFHRLSKRHNKPDNVNNAGSVARPPERMQLEPDSILAQTDARHLSDQVHGDANVKAEASALSSRRSSIADSKTKEPAARSHRASQIGLALSHDGAAVVPSLHTSAVSLIDELDGSLSGSGGNSPRALPIQTSSSVQHSIHDAGLAPSTGWHDAPQPGPWLSKSRKRHMRTSTLVRSWLLVAGLYRRAGLFDDADGAVEEARKLMSLWDTETAAETSSEDSSGGWGQPLSRETDRLWGDILSERGHLFQAQGDSHEALAQYEMALSRCADHPIATVGLCNILLDIATSQLPPRPCEPDPLWTGDESSLSLPESPKKEIVTHSDSQDPTLELERLAARDRAYGLLSSLTKLDEGWDYSDAWLALARVYEESGQADKARDALWWCIELEDGRPIRHWRNAGGLGYVL